MSSDKKRAELIHGLIEAIEGLARANRLTGLWDHVRFEECKKADALIDTSQVILSERQSRKNVELRAYYRREIDKSLAGLVNRDQKTELESNS
jgi:hypothetical protein